MHAILVGIELCFTYTDLFPRSVAGLGHRDGEMMMEGADAHIGGPFWGVPTCRSSWRPIVRIWLMGVGGIG